MNLGNLHSTSKSDSINNTSAPNRFLSQRAQVTLVIVLLIAFTLWNMPQPILLSDQETRQLLTLGPLPEPPLDPTNRWSGNAQAANFGHDLFFSTSLSLNNSVSCATCHKPELYFTDGRDIAMGLALGDRHTQGVLNAAHHKWFHWDGSEDSLWSQALHPFESATEMGLTRVQVIEKIASNPDFLSQYQGIFGPLPQVNSSTPQESEAIDRAFSNVGKAIAAYERTLITEPSPFDQWLEQLRQGNAQPTNSFNASAIRGAKLFVGRANCIECHNGPLFSDDQFHMIGVPLANNDLPTDRGRIDGVVELHVDPFNTAGKYSDDPNGTRAKITLATQGEPDQWGQFRTPSLRNVANTAPYMHQGQLNTLEQVIAFYSTLDGAISLDHHSESVLKPLQLSPQESRDLLVFLQSLSGKIANSN